MMSLSNWIVKSLIMVWASHPAHHQLTKSTYSDSLFYDQKSCKTSRIPIKFSFTLVRFAHFNRMEAALLLELFKCLLVQCSISAICSLFFQWRVMTRVKMHPPAWSWWYGRSGRMQRSKDDLWPLHSTFLSWTSCWHVGCREAHKFRSPAATHRHLKSECRRGLLGRGESFCNKKLEKRLLLLLPTRQ